MANRRSPPDLTHAVCRDWAVSSELAVRESSLFTAETAHALVTQLRWAMGSRTEVGKLEHYKPLMEEAAKRWPK